MGCPNRKESNKTPLTASDKLEKSRAYQRAYYREHREKALEYQRTYQYNRNRLAGRREVRSSRRDIDGLGKKGLNVSDLQHKSVEKFARDVNRIIRGREVFVGTG